MIFNAYYFELVQNKKINKLMIIILKIININHINKIVKCILLKHCRNIFLKEVGKSCRMHIGCLSHISSYLSIFYIIT